MYFYYRSRCRYCKNIFSVDKNVQISHLFGASTGGASVMKCCCLPRMVENDLRIEEWWGNRAVPVLPRPPQVPSYAMGMAMTSSTMPPLYSNYNDISPHLRGGLPSAPIGGHAGGGSHVMGSTYSSMLYHPRPPQHIMPVGNMRAMMDQGYSAP